MPNDPLLDSMNEQGATTQRAVLPTGQFLTVGPCHPASHPPLQNAVGSKEHGGKQDHHRHNGTERIQVKGRKDEQQRGAGKKGHDPRDFEALVDDGLGPLVGVLHLRLFICLGVVEQIGTPDQQDHRSRRDARRAANVKTLGEVL